MVTTPNERVAPQMVVSATFVCVCDEGNVTTGMALYQCMAIVSITDHVITSLHVCYMESDHLWQSVFGPYMSSSACILLTGCTVYGSSNRWHIGAIMHLEI